jgi:serine protease AprX
MPCELDEGFGSIPLAPTGRAARSMAAGGDEGQTAILVGEVHSSRLHDLQETSGVTNVYSDPEILSFACGQLDCDSSVSKGDGASVATALGVDRAWNHGYRGQGVVVGVVDGGVDQALYPVLGGWSPLPSSPPGVASHWGEHGNMCAFDSLVAAPDAKLYDLGIGKTPGSIAAFLSGGLQAFQWALNRYRTDGTPQVLSNSWGLFQDAWDPFPPGHPGNYTHNPNHPFTRKALEVMDEGILVAFAAGNCGDPCPDGRCGSDHGSGKSIRGANGHERSLCVGAVNVHRQRIGYSSQGPATLFDQKPDICGYSHFKGHFDPDSGTSAACPVVAGVLALLRSRFPELRQDEARRVLTSTAINICAPGFDHDSGHGVVNAAAAYEALRRDHLAGLPTWLIDYLRDLGVLDKVLQRAAEVGALG